MLFLVLSLLLVAVFLAALCFGSVPLDPGDVWAALKAGDLDSPSLRILLYLRLPRACAGVLAGMALALSGVLIQAVLQNPMAGPNVIGVNSGAGLGAALTVAAFPGLAGYLPFAAFFGGVGTCLCIYAIARKTGGRRMTVVLVGIAVSSVLNAGINTVKTLFPDSVYDADAFMIGGLSGVTLSSLILPGILILAGSAAAFLLGREADILALGEDTARSLGLRVRTVQLTMLVLASVLASSAVSFAGLLGFVGLVVPHIARRLVGQNHRRLIPVSALGGAILVTASDLLSRVLFAPGELPVGILLSFVGGPFFIFLILKERERYD